MSGEHSAGFVKAESMREAVNINLGLLALKKCIDALNSEATYVPYQDSKLTMLLSEGLGGNCKTSIIVCAAMDTHHIGETISTLRFGEKCSKVEKDVDNKGSVMEAVLRKIDEEIQVLEQLIKSKEKWEVEERVREDIHATEGTFDTAFAKEVIRVTVLRGAEQERKQLEELLRKRYELTGRSLDEILSGSHNVLGFGKDYAEAYGIGKKYDMERDFETENARFERRVDLDSLPKAVKEKKATWKSGDELETDSKKLEEEADKAKRSRLVYAGISA